MAYLISVLISVPISVVQKHRRIAHASNSTFAALMLILFATAPEWRATAADAAGSPPRAAAKSTEKSSAGKSASAKPNGASKAAPAPAAADDDVPGEPSAESRIVSVFVSQDFINEQIALHSKSKLLTDLKLELDPAHGQIFLRGKLQVPVEELRAVNLDPSLGAFRFQVTIKPETTKQGHLILELPLEETYFYPANSKDRSRDRVIVPVQMLSLALASARGYLAALSGDFSSFDRRTAKLSALLKGLDRSIAQEKNADAREELENQRTALKLQMAAVPVERKQLESASKEVEHILGFTGEKELNLNDEFAARKNALILKIKLSQLVPFLKDIDLGGIRIRRDQKDGAGENYFAVDINSRTITPPAPNPAVKSQPRPGMKVAPALILRLNQDLLESTVVAEQEKKAMGSNLRDFKVDLKDDGLHVSGKWHKFFITIPFDTTVDFVSTGPDVFEVKVRELDVGGIDFEFMAQFVLEAIKVRLDKALSKICTFTYVGKEKDHSRALRVTVEPKTLVPAFPDLHLVGIDVRDREFLLKIGHVQ